MKQLKAMAFAMRGMFDISAFTTQPVTGKLDTELIPYPEDVYTLQVGGDEKGIGWRSGTSAGKDGKPGNTWVAMDLKCRVIAMEDGSIEELAKERGRPLDQLYITHGIMLDLTETGALDIGPQRNVSLGQLREAVGQNSASEPWHYDMLKGQVFKAKIVIKPDKEDPNKLYNRFAAVTAAE